MSGHIKVEGFVDDIDGARWFARLFIDGDECNAEMRDPLPTHAQIGSRFTIHQTKAGHTYLYWITRPLISKRQRKKARAKVRRWQRAFQLI